MRPGAVCQLTQVSEWIGLTQREAPVVHKMKVLPTQPRSRSLYDADDLLLEVCCFFDDLPRTDPAPKALSARAKLETLNTL